MILVADAHKIHEYLALAKLLGNSSELRVFVANHDSLRVIEHGINIVDHQFRYVRNPVEDEIPIRTNQAANVHIPIIDPQIITLTKQALNHFDERASRRSSVPALKLNPKTPTRIWPLFTISCRAGRFAFRYSAGLR